MLLLHTGHDHLARGESLADFLSAWDLSVYVMVILLALLSIYAIGGFRLGRRSRSRRGTGFRDIYYLIGIGAVFVALSSPIDVYSGDLFFIHMIQHLLLVMIAAPFILLSSPVANILWSCPLRLRHYLGGFMNRTGIFRQVLRGATIPIIAWFMYVVTFWVWHSPGFYNAALSSDGLHVIEHAMMFGSGIVFWWPVIGPAPLKSHMPHPLKFLYLFLALFQNIILAAILTFAEWPVYSYYQVVPNHWGIGGEWDQQLAGVLMWIPGTMMYFVAISIIFFAWLEQEERYSISRQKANEARQLYLEKMSTEVIFPAPKNTGDN